MACQALNSVFLQGAAVSETECSSGKHHILAGSAAHFVFARPALAPTPAIPQKKTPMTRYERLTLIVVLLSWGLMTAVIFGVHVGNYGLETKTSSKSPTHSSFYEVSNASHKAEQGDK